VEPGELDGDAIHVPSIFVHRIIQSKNLKKWIERRTVRKQA
jgi:3-oxoacid CoA-transferase subunit A